MYKKACKNCHWYEKYVGVCFNGDSEWCADTPDPEGVCEYWMEETCHE